MLVLVNIVQYTEPIVNTPTDVLECSMKTKMDCLVLQNFYIVNT